MFNQNNEESVFCLDNYDSTKRTQFAKLLLKFNVLVI